MRTKIADFCWYAVISISFAALCGTVILAGCEYNGPPPYQSVSGGESTNNSTETVPVAVTPNRIDRIVGVKLSPRSDDFPRYDVAIMVQDDPLQPEQYRFLYLIVPVNAITVFTDAPTTEMAYAVFDIVTGQIRGDPQKGSGIVSRLTIHVHNRDQVH